MTVKFIIVDEAAFTREALLTDTVYPCGLDHSTSIALSSSPNGNENHFNRLLLKKDRDGKAIFTAFRIGDICEACKDAEQPYLCHHVDGDIDPCKFLYISKLEKSFANHALEQSSKNESV